MLYIYISYIDIIYGIFSEIDEPLDFNENMSTNIVFNVVF